MKNFFLTFVIFIFTISGCNKDNTPNNVSILGTWGGTELNNFLDVCKLSGVKVKFETTRDLDAILSTRIEANNLPDIAILPNPAKMKELAKKSKIQPLSFLKKDVLINDYGKNWLDLGSYGGKLFGIFFKTANKSLIWYNPKEFKKNGWEIPKTWDELINLTDKIAKQGKIPWAIGADKGWPLTDWVENIYMRSAGPQMYQKWIDHEISWTDESIKKTFMLWGEIATNSKYLYGGVKGALSMSFQEAAFSVFQNPPKAFMYYEGDFMSEIITSEISNLKIGEDIDFFPFPPISETYGVPVIGGADIVVIFNKNKDVKKLVSFLSTEQAHGIWVKKGGFVSHNKKVSLASYPDRVNEQSARMITNATIFAYDASDMMPATVGNQGGFWDACKKYMENPQNLNNILIDMENLANSNY